METRKLPVGLTDGSTVEVEQPIYQSEIPLGELIAGEIPDWVRGVCQIIALKSYEPMKAVAGGMIEEPTALAVRGDNDFLIEVVPLDEGLSLEEVDQRIATAIREEMEAL